MTWSPHTYTHSPTHPTPTHILIPIRDGTSLNFHKPPTDVVSIISYESGWVRGGEGRSHGESSHHLTTLSMENSFALWSVGRVSQLILSTLHSLTVTVCLLSQIAHLLLAPLWNVVYSRSSLSAGGTLEQGLVVGEPSKRMRGLRLYRVGEGEGRGADSTVDKSSMCPTYICTLTSLAQTGVLLEKLSEVKGRLSSQASKVN